MSREILNEMCPKCGTEVYFTEEERILAALAKYASGATISSKTASGKKRTVPDLGFS